MKFHFHIFCFAGLVVIALACVSRADEQVTLPPAGFVDEAAFREGLRQRGLTDWLEQYLADRPPVDEVDKQLRRREQLLEQASRAETTFERRHELAVEASDILSRLIVEHPKHPACWRWRLELARDMLERLDPDAFDAVLFYELPGRDRETVCRLSERAIEIIKALRQRIAEAWNMLESLDESAFEQLAASSSLGLLESLDGRSAFLLAWAELYHSLTADLSQSQRQQAFTGLLAEVTEHYGWTQVASDSRQRCGALIIATIAARRCGQFLEAKQYARDMISAYKTIEEPSTREQLRKASILAVLEQIRIPRDAGQFEVSLKSIKKIREWLNRAAPEDLQTALAIALAERSVLVGQLAPPTNGPANDPRASLLHPAQALEPIKSLMSGGPQERDALYLALAGALVDEPATPKLIPLQVQLLAGASVAEAITWKRNAKPAVSGRLDKLITALNEQIETSPTAKTSTQKGELLFLLGQVYYLADKPLEAVNTLVDLVEGYPEHDRSTRAGEQAVAMARNLLANAGDSVSPVMRKAFVRAGRLLMKRAPGSPIARDLPYLIALTLEKDGQFAEAAGEYAAVGSGDPLAIRAALGRVRCLRNLMNRAIADPHVGDSAADELARNALVAAREAFKMTQTSSLAEGREQEFCLVADIALSLAEILNHPLIDQPVETVAVLKDFEKRFADCPQAVGSALRERILALRRLKRLAEARRVVEKYLEAEPRSAGPVMAELLEAIRQEINAAADQGDDEKVKGISSEAVELAQALLAWSEDNPEQMAATDRLRIRTWLAWSLLNVGKPAEALKIYEAGAREAGKVLPADSALGWEIRLGQAECLLALDHAERALPVFAEVWSRVPENSANWWRALVGSLKSHSRLGSDPHQILQSIRQQQHLHPDLGGPRRQRELLDIERINQAKTEKDLKN